MNFAIKYFSIIILLLFIGCKESTKNNDDISNSKINHTDTISYNNESKDTLSIIDMIDELIIMEPSSPFRIVPSRNQNIGKKYAILDIFTYNDLKLNEIYGEYDTAFTYRIYFSVNFHNDFRSLIVESSKSKYDNIIYILTYNNNFDLIDSLLTYNKNDKQPSVLSYVLGSKIYVEYLTLDTAIEYNISPEGAFEKSNRPVTFKHYRYLGKFKGFFDLPVGVINSKNGVIVTDSKGDSIGRRDFGEVVFLVDETQNFNNIEENTRVMIVLNKDSVQSGDDFYIDKSNIGYISTGKLFNTIKKSEDEGIDYYEYSYLRIGYRGLDKYEYVDRKARYEGSKIDLSELLEIKRIDFTDYEESIAKKNKPPTRIDSLKKDKKIVLHFENGEQLILKDTTFLNWEYRPTLSFSVFKHEDFKDAYIVRKSMFFSDEIHTVISKKNGDTLYQFNDFPHLSPNRQFGVLVYSDFECSQQTTLSIKQLKEGEYVNYASMGVISWSYPYIPDSSQNNSRVRYYPDFSLHWVNEDEFILKAKNPEECRVENFIESFYLKYRIL